MSLTDEFAGDTPSRPVLPQRSLGVGLVVVLLLATLGEGGAAAVALAAWHVALVLLVVWQLLRPEPMAGQITGLPRAAGIALLVVAAIGLARAPYVFGAWLWWLELLSSCAIALLAARCGPRLLATLAAWLPWAALVQVAWMIAQRMLHGDPRPAGTFLNPNHLAAWLLAVALLSTGYALHDAAPRRRTGRWVVVLCLLGGVVMTGSRGALVGLGAGGIAIGVMNWRRFGRRGRLVALGVAGVATLAAGVLFAARLAEADPFRWHRWRIWAAAAQAGVEAPWTGSGPGQFAALADRLQFDDGTPPLAHERRFSTPHSDLLRAWAELGLPGAAAVFGLIVASGMALAARRRRGEIPPAAAGAIAALWAMLAHACVDDLTERPGVYLLAAALLGALLGRPPEAAAARLTLGLRGASAVSLLVALLVGDLGPTRGWLEMVRLPRGRLDVVERQRLDRALAMNPMHPDAWLRRAEDLTADREHWSVEQYGRARDAAEHAARLHPTAVAYARGVARVEAQGCRTLWPDVAARERAAAWYERAAELAPTDPTIPLELGAFLLDLGDPSGAERAAERALAIEPRSVAPRVLLAAALLDRPEPRIERAAQLLVDARQEGADHAAYVAELEGRGAPERGYARALLHADPERLARVERILSRARTVATHPAPIEP